MSMSSEDLDLYKTLLFLNSESVESEKAMYEMLNQAIIRKKGVASVSVLRNLSRITEKTRRTRPNTAFWPKPNESGSASDREVKTWSFLLKADRPELPDYTDDDHEDGQPLRTIGHLLQRSAFSKGNVDDGPPTRQPPNMTVEEFGCVSKQTESSALEAQTKMYDKFKLLFDCESD